MFCDELLFRVSMQIQKSFKGQSPYGKLYLVATPIGNLEIDLKARSKLKRGGLLLPRIPVIPAHCLSYWIFQTKQISFHEHNAKESIPDLD